jgi:hypothetical protein
VCFLHESLPPPKVRHFREIGGSNEFPMTHKASPQGINPLSIPAATSVESVPFARAGSQCWLQVAVARAPHLLDEAFRRAGAIDANDTIEWRSPLAQEGFAEYRDGEVLRCLGIDHLPRRQLAEFWPRRGPVWDALGKSAQGRLILVEAKAHIPEAASPPSKASEKSIVLIRQSLEEVRRFYAPKATADWTGLLYQYANRLAFQYFFAHLNNQPTRLVFLNFYNAVDVGGPESEAEWRGATRLIHAILGLPASLDQYGVFHAYVDASLIDMLLTQPNEPSKTSDR